MSPLRLRNAIPTFTHKSTHSPPSTVVFRGARVSYRFLPISLFIRQLPALVLRCGLFSWGCWYPRYVWRRPTNSVLLSAMVCITRSFYWLWSLAQDTRVFFNSRRFISGSRLASIFIPRSLADFTFRHPTSFHFSIYFLSSMCQYHRLISALHAFATSHHASYFGSREIGSVQKESTRPHTLKTNHPLKPRLSHVYTMTLPSFRLRATNLLPAQLSAFLCLFMRGFA
ncbi:hypothetical protein OG21DRAFT_568013 [Imleria badia]|nr:hypothetical protein OG21DRAFT_568013 [Imleria badia]